MQINCIKCSKFYHHTWSREWDTEAHEYRYIPYNEFVCLTCKIGGKK